MCLCESNHHASRRSSNQTDLICPQNFINDAGCLKPVLPVRLLLLLLLPVPPMLCCHAGSFFELPSIASAKCIIFLSAGLQWGWSYSMLSIIDGCSAPFQNLGLTRLQLLAPHCCITSWDTALRELPFARQDQTLPQSTLVTVWSAQHLHNPKHVLHGS